MIPLSEILKADVTQFAKYRNYYKDLWPKDTMNKGSIIAYFKEAFMALNTVELALLNIKDGREKTKNGVDT